ncbi:MAG: AraC family transcriptional regulator [Paludibacterium sp.]|uniref:AraC family transcriptional regulator n=1 Tax=Paludibacterium sp. TaxID=1917523 RepID=UPI0025F37EE4|nr:AraC family transcriptional regulator [Paludibacterium sp.]MBV8048365.1 AraC family transcriptional regulator [Paludibacterium sp.]MBV8647702.1 AraC family transcriptional regulator [Paludibacterium sp.]
MTTPRATDKSDFFRADDIGRLEYLDASYSQRVFPPHFHEEYVVNALTLGAQSYRHRGGTHLAGVGALVLINPGEVHTGQTAHETGWAYRGYYPSASLLQRLAREISGQTGINPYFRQTVVLDGWLAQQLNLLHGLLRTSSDCLQREAALQAVFAQVLQRHMAVRPQAVPDAGNAVSKAQQMLADDPGGNLSLNTLSQTVGLSPWQLCRQFKRRIGLSPVAWRNQLRVSRARGLLASGMPPGEVAQTLGFADQAHLTRVFCSIVGTPPGRYQRTMR